MAAFNKHNQFVQDLARKKHDLGADTFKVLLTLTAPTATNAVKADLTEIAAGNGYTAGGNTPTITSCTQTSGTLSMILADTVFTASGGAFAAARYVDLYNDTQTSPAKPLIGWWDYGSSFTLATGETLTVDFDGTNGVLQIA